MKVTTRNIDDTLFEIKVKSGYTTIKENISTTNTPNRDSLCSTYIPYVPESVIEQFIDVAYEANRFNGTGDVIFVLKIIKSVLIESEKKQLIALLTGESE